MPRRLSKGRPTLLTPERQQHLVDLIAAGNYLETACACVGIHYTTLRNWMVRGEEEGTGIYFDFFNAITRAEAEAEAQAVQSIAKAMPDDWRAGAHFLERRYADRWGRQDRMKADMTHTGQVNVQHGVDSDSANALLAALGYDPLGAAESGDASGGSGGDRAPEAGEGGGD